MSHEKCRRTSNLVRNQKLKWEI